MKKIWMAGLALCIGVSLSSCDDDNDVRPMGITPAGTFGDGTGTDTTNITFSGPGSRIDEYRTVTEKPDMPEM